MSETRFSLDIEKRFMTGVYTEVNKKRKSRDKPHPPHIAQASYSLVKKTSAPEIPVKSDFLMRDLQLEDNH